MTADAIPLSKARLHDYVELAKVRLVSLVLLSTVVGFIMGSQGPIDIVLLLVALLGTGLVAAGSMALNQWMEKAEDGRMARTAGRPLPAGRLKPLEAFLFGTLLSLVGLATLYFLVNLQAAFLSFLTLVSYLALYTPLKKKTSLCNIVGAIPGAVPPLIGWAAAAGRTTYEAWILFAIIFLWQMPHFLAIAWFCRKEYADAGFRMLSVEDPSGEQVARQMVLYTLALLPVSLLPTIVGLTGTIYFFGILALGIYFTVQGFLSLKDLEQKARPLFRTSILYLAILLILMVVDKS